MNWNGESVLVTGGASFIGSHLVEELVAEGADVRVADDFSSGKREFLSAVEDDIEILEGDLRRWEVAEEASAGIDTVFHLAADHGGRGYISSYPANCATNMALDTMVYETAAQNGVERICFASSACTYPTDIQQERKRLAEDMVSFEERGGAYADEVYGWAKLMGERSLMAYEEQYDIDASIVRIFTAYGPRENETHAIIALMAKALAQQDPYEIWGDGEQTRNFTYVKDITSALRLAAENVTDATPINAGISRYVTINEAAKAVFAAFDWEPGDIDYLTDKPVGVRHRAADTTRAEELLGWEPEYTVEEGIANTVEWYVENRDEEEVRENLETLLYER
ncbi:NAD-dependent epimerase/dehydratase family protein [Halorhabdus sp. CUG00001]|uniref:NAD-dependent epimerase/dehydratase family protein n=1 Tax=Halorhabdus sp. CUG00001 TaxID=2600297 RepID=UPI00131ADD2D|nr:NAD-dependent epimerase/dehydratase family protein [Halorhabdus sp. CUG00001]